ncbi:MAG: DNA alkylation repair protein [Thiovulaceae bacterium]|nr:DNA alkylation repair protein [Sulfurimonadaceae bacterium]
MAEPLKYLYNEGFISKLSKELREAYKDFNSDAFTATVFDAQWDALELKERMRHISRTLEEFLPSEYPKALSILKKAAPQFSGFEPMIFPDFVEVFGLDDYDESIQALEHFTKYSSSEFAVRPFILKYPDMMRQMKVWAGSDNEHVRRLASEGCRPRLPWAMALPAFKEDPTLVLEILEKLKDDLSEYVRRSVANNLNDISKDHPAKVKSVAKDWMGKTKEGDWIVKHACRTLLKAGDTEVLALFGFTSPETITMSEFQVAKSVKMGSDVEFSFKLKSTKELGKLRLEYAIGFLRKNGKHNQKVFKISESDIKDVEKSINKKHSFKSISTRKYYLGIHQLVVIINGVAFAQEEFELY